MGASNYLKAGKLVPVDLILSDGAIDKFVRARVFNSSGILLHTFNLIHIENGLYSYTSYYMPIVNFINIVYSVYEDDLFTILDISRSQDVDTFILDQTPEIIGADYLIGFIDNDDLIGFVSSADGEIELIGFVENDELLGYVENEYDLTGFVENDNLIGILRECV